MWRIKTHNHVLTAKKDRCVVHKCMCLLFTGTAKSLFLTPCTGLKDFQIIIKLTDW